MVHPSVSSTRSCVMRVLPWALGFVVLLTVVLSVTSDTSEAIRFPRSVGLLPQPPAESDRNEVERRGVPIPLPPGTPIPPGCESSVPVNTFLWQSPDDGSDPAVVFVRSVGAGSDAQADPRLALDGDLTTVFASSGEWSVAFAHPVALRALRFVMPPTAPALIVTLLDSRTSGLPRTVLTLPVPRTSEPLPFMTKRFPSPRDTFVEFSNVTAPFDTVVVRAASSRAVLIIHEVEIFVRRTGFVSPIVRLCLGQNRTQPDQERLVVPQQPSGVTGATLCRLPRLTPNVPKFKPVTPIDVPKQFDCAIVTVLLGHYEKTLKRVVPQTHECARLAFTDRADLAGPNSGGWTVIMVPLSDSDTTVTPNTHVFRKGKYYKQQFYRFLPRHIRFVYWLDATMRIDSPDAMKTWNYALKHNSSLLSHIHERRSVYDELLASYPKYSEKFLTWSEMVAWFLEHVADGFCDFYWRATGDRRRPSENELTRVVQRGLCVLSDSAEAYRQANALVRTRLQRPDARHARCPKRGFPAANASALAGHGTASNASVEPLRPNLAVESQIPLFTTSVVGFDLHAAWMTDFLDYWYTITVDHWQDQLAFSVAAWKFGVRPLLWGETPLGWTPPMFVHLPHGL